MNQAKIFSQRINKLQKNIPKDTILLLSNQRQIYYFSGFNFLVNSEREAFLVCTNNQAFLIYTNFSPIDNFEFINYVTGTNPSELKKNIENIASETKNNILLFDNTTLYVSEFEELKKIESLSCEPFVQNQASILMTVKDSTEIENISNSCQITTKVLTETIAQLANNQTEIEIANIIKQRFQNYGITELAFPTIVAFGSNSAKPHHQPTQKKLESETVVLIDLGGKFQGYCADMTRTIWFGSNPDKKFQEIENIVKTAYDSSITELKQFFESRKSEQTDQILHKKLMAKQLDSAARVYISNQGYGENFIHTTGHGLGLEIHEQPSISWRNDSEILPNQVITIEPGIYLDGSFGYRHENTILTTKTGIQVLTQDI